VCVIPSGEVRRIKHLRVFIITATWSVFAYVWLYFILEWSSYGEVEVWEALLTFFFFPATVATAYVADKRLLFWKYTSKEYRLNRRGVIVGAEGADANNDNVVAAMLRKDAFKKLVHSHLCIDTSSESHLNYLLILCHLDQHRLFARKHLRASN
jgi:solute carrier family 8 (sodium/calcium exchanger)